MEQVYELNLPSFYEIINASFKGFENLDEQDKKYKYLFDYNLTDILKPEWLTFLGFKWRSYRYFKKSGPGSIHTDLSDLKMVESYRLHGRPCFWGINWVFNGSGTIKFWEYKNLHYIGNTIGSDNNPKLGVVPKFFPLSKPDYQYDNLENHVYLTNASLPHVAEGFNKRCVFSLRADNINLNYTWEEAVDKFKDYII